MPSLYSGTLIPFETKGRCNGFRLFYVGSSHLLANSKNWTMKKGSVVFFILLVFVNCNSVLGQGGWIHDTNPLNDVTAYVTGNSYVGASFVELNGDEYVDIFAPPKFAFINNGDGTYTAMTPLPFAHLNSTSGSSCADLDNDGDNDLIIAGVPSKVYFNNGSGILIDSSAKVPGLAGYGAFGVAIGDYNKDRQLDFVFAHAKGFLIPAVSQPCRLYRQKMPSFSTDSVSGYPFTTSLDAYTNPYWSDYDLDGDMDLFIASGPADGTTDYDYCFKNMKVETGTDTMVPMTSELFATQTQDGQCYNFIDFDNDGDFDLCLTNYRGVATRFYVNNSGTYNLTTTPFTTTTTSLANCWGDYDNDGDLDVIITNDNQTTKYYQNNGDGTFSYLSGGFTTPTAICSIANGDYDNDGDLDLFVNGVGNTGTAASVGLYINDAVAIGRKFVNISLVGVASNRSAIGAIVRLKATIGGTPVWQMREVNAQNTFQGQNDLRVHFGLNDATSIDSIIVRWPSGAIGHFENVASGLFYKIVEGAGISTLSTPIQTKSFAATLYPNPSGNTLWLSFGDDAMLSVAQYRILDMLGKQWLNGAIAEPDTKINISQLPPGEYLVSVDGYAAKKFVKL